MSILDAFKQVRDDKQSLEDLASLPQTLIMNMVQRKEIPQEHLPMIMAKKAEMAQTAANMKAAQAQQQQGQPGTIMEQLMAKNAAEEAARSAPAIEEQTQVGIASNPTPEMNFAGGGIVAFAEGDLVSGKAWEDMTQEEKDAYIASNPALQRSIAMGNIPSRIGDFLNKYNPVSGTAYRDGLSNFFKSDGRDTWETGRKARTGEIPMFVGNEPTEKGSRVAAGTMSPDQNLQSVKRKEASDLAAFDNATALFEKERAAKPTAAATDAQPVGKKDITLPASKPSATDALRAEQKGIFDEYKKLYAEDKEASKAARDEAKWMRIMEAGLNIMGGESPYALANIGKGAAAASKGFAEDVRGLRAEERERNKQLAALGIKEKEFDLEGRKLDITEQRYKDLSNLERQKIGILAQRNIDDKMAQGVKDIFAQLMKKYDPLLSDGSMTEADLYRQAQEMYTSTSGKGMKGGSTAPTNTGISYNSFMGKK